MSSDAARARLSELTDFAAPWAVSIAATLRIADHIEAGATSVSDLAERSAVDPDALGRLLRYLVTRGVFAEEDGTYANTEASRLLLDEADWRPWLDLDDAPGIWAEAWTSLLEAVRTGTPGRDEDWYEREMLRTNRAESFDALMASQAKANAEEIAEAYDWSGIAHVVDVGGGTGTLLRTLLASHSHLRGTLFDLPRVVAAAEPAERLDAVAGSFFDDPLPQGDAYILSQILHGFPDEAAARILGRCREAAATDARIVLVEEVIPEQPTRRQASFDLLMFTLGGGRQRTLDEFRALAEPVGLALRSSLPLETGNALVELGRPETL